MHIIIDFNPSGDRSKMRLIGRRGLAIAALSLLLLFIAASALTASWLARSEFWKSDDLRAAENQSRQWREEMERLESDLAALKMRLVRLHERGEVLAGYVGLPGEQLFTPEASMCPSDEEVASRDAGELSARLAEQSVQSGELEEKYRLLEKFSVTRATLRDTLPMPRPVIGRNWVASGYGYRRDPFTGRRAFHAGIDYAARTGTPVVAGATGVVIYTGRLGNYGNTIQIYHGDGVSTLYGHLHKIDTALWSYVERGETIGTVGSTGRSTGPHLHYEIRLNNRPRPINKTIRQLLKDRDLPAEG